jgi:hypothetical protein
MLQGMLAFAFDWRVFATAAGISKPIGLVGLIVAAVYAAFAVKTRADTERLKALPPADRAKSLDPYATRYGVNLAGLSPDKQYYVVLQDMQNRQRKQLVAMLLAVVVALSCVAMAFLYQRPPAESELTSDQSVTDYMRQILSLRGDFEAKNPGWSWHVRSEGQRLASLIGSFEPDRLRPARKVIQREYKGWALLLVARTFGEEAQERDAKQHRIEYAGQAVEEFDAALSMMNDIEMRYQTGKGGPDTVKLYEWMTGESADVSRTHFLKAVALAVIARAGGRYTKEDVLNELAVIPPTYLLSYPPEHNPDLYWARH